MSATSTNIKDFSYTVLIPFAFIDCIYFEFLKFLDLV